MAPRLRFVATVLIVVFFVLSCTIHLNNHSIERIESTQVPVVIVPLTQPQDLTVQPQEPHIQGGSSPKWKTSRNELVPLWGRTLVSMPHASLFSSDDDLKTLLLAAQSHFSKKQDLTQVKVNKALIEFVSDDLSIGILPELYRVCELQRTDLIFLYARVSGLAPCDSPRSSNPTTRAWLDRVVGCYDFSLVATLSTVHKQDYGTIAGFSVFSQLERAVWIFLPLPRGSHRVDSHTHRLALKLEHAKWSGVDEVNDRTQHRVGRYLIPKGFEINLGSTTQRNTVCLRSIFLPSLRSLFGWWSSNNSFRFGLPWSSSGVAFPLPFDTTRRQLLKIASSSMCMMISGDSQSRSLFRAFRSRFGDRREEHREEKYKIFRSDVFESNTGLHLAYRWDNYLANSARTTRELLNFSGVQRALVVGMGAHSASWGQHTFTEFQVNVSAAVISILSVLSSNVNHVHVVWYGAPAWPRPKPFRNFRITNARLGLFNYLALEVVSRQSSWHSFDFFGVTQAVQKWSRDGSHYDKSPAIDAAVDGIASLLA